MVALQKPGVAGLDDFDLLQHLANDGLDMLVVDRHALQPVDLLDLIDQEVRQGLDTQDTQDVVGVGIAVDDVLALADRIAVVDGDVLGLGDQELDRLALFGADLMRRLFL